jgi:hypothetical protein
MIQRPISRSFVDDDPVAVEDVDLGVCGEIRGDKVERPRGQEVVGIQVGHHVVRPELGLDVGEALPDGVGLALVGLGRPWASFAE